MRWLWMVVVCLGCTPEVSPSVEGSAQVSVPAPEKGVEIAPGFRVPERKGERPKTSEAPTGTMIAHQQQSGNAPRALQDALFARVMTLEGVTTGPSLISVKGARAFFLPREKVVAQGLVGGVEWGHLHPPYDGSLHLTLSPEIVERIERAGWGERHPRAAGVAMIYGPRDDAELEVVYGLVELAWRHAQGR